MKKVSSIMIFASVALALIGVVFEYRAFRSSLFEAASLPMVERVGEAGARAENILDFPSVNFESNSLKLTLAKTVKDREQGLSDKMSLGQDEGMLFIFDSPGRYGFWMKNMLFPIDMIWLDQDAVVVSIDSDVTPDSYPNIYYPKSDALYVLETNAGLSKRWGLEVGHKLNLTF
jgi:uncharacterized membrane protein (UPF0127 family)